MQAKQIPWLLTLAGALVGGAVGAPVAAQEVRVQDDASLRQALRNARPGTRILLAPGRYHGRLYLENLRGAPDRPIVIASADPQRPAIFSGGGGLQFTDPAYLEIRDLILTGSTANGLNIDDAGSFDSPAHHITLRNLQVRDVGPEGNRDGIKLSGVQDFRVENCTVERWGSGGSGIDMVGCHRGVIEGCVFRHRNEEIGSGVQIKGGSSRITVRRCRFEEAGGRAVNIGGSTDLHLFRPLGAKAEATEITVEGNTFIGGRAPVAFVGVDGAVVRHNTIYRPKRWVLRILQETVGPNFHPCRNGVFTDNIIVFRSAECQTTVNISPNTAPQTFQFARNVWYCEDRPERSQPSLPTAEKEGIVGKDPQFRDPAKGDLRLKPGSPAAGKGADALAEG